MIHSAEMKVAAPDKKSDIGLPSFTFSFLCSCRTNQSGRFSLFTDGEAEDQSPAKEMIEPQIELQSDPIRPSTWYIPEKRIEGYRVQQRMTPRLIDKQLYPED
jgi:hypothetical protein